MFETDVWDSDMDGWDDTEPDEGSTLTEPEREPEVIPPDLDSWEPGAPLAAVLGATDVEALSPEDQVVVLRAYQRLASYAQAGLYRSMAAITNAYRAEVDDGDEEFIHHAAEAEIGSALHLTRRAASSELALAEDLQQRLPEVGEALARGELGVRQAKVIARETCHLSPETARTVALQLLPQAGRLTTGQLAARIRRLSVEADPEEAEARFRTAHEERRMVTEPTSDGTADLTILGLSPERALEASGHVDRLARHLKAQPGETRTLDQLRADVAVDLLRGYGLDVSQDPGRRPATAGSVTLHLDLTTLAGLDERPGELGGYGPILADIARQVALSARSWEFCVTHPESGAVVHTGVTRRRPTAAQARRVRAEHPTCTFPGCRMPAMSCDLDHRRPYGVGGVTCPCNLAPLCRRHHVIRHRAGWKLEVLPDGSLRWTSPLGHTYTTRGRSP